MYLHLEFTQRTRLLGQAPASDIASHRFGRKEISHGRVVLLKTCFAKLRYKQRVI